MNFFLCAFLFLENTHEACASVQFLRAFCVCVFFSEDTYVRFNLHYTFYNAISVDQREILTISSCVQFRDSFGLR